MSPTVPSTPTLAATTRTNLRILIATSAFLLSGLSPSLAHGQSDEPTTEHQQPTNVHEDDESDEPTPPDEPTLEVTVQGQRQPRRGTSTEKLDRRMLDRLGASSVSDSLDRLPSAAAAIGSRGERIISLRGFDQRQVRVTIDGIPLHAPYEGQIDLGKYPLGLVNHITIAKGSSPAFNGPNGLGGAIDIATRVPGYGPILTLSTETAPPYAQRFSATASTGKGPIAILGGVSVENDLYFPLAGSFTPTFNEDGGRRENSDRQSLSAVAKAKWEIDDNHELIASHWYLNGQYGAPPGVFDLNRRFWRWTDWHSNSYSIGHSYRDTFLSTHETIYFSAVGNTLDSYDNDSYLSQMTPVAGTSIYDDSVIGGHARLAYRFACTAARCMEARGWIGGRHEWHHSRDNIGTPKISASTTVLTSVAELEGPLGNKLIWIAGSQFDAEFPSQGTAKAKPETVGVGPMGSLTWQPHEAVDVTASVARTTRFPTLKERHSSAFETLAPNPNLAPERATNISLDTAVRPWRQLSFDIGAFDSELTDLIVHVPINNQTKQWQNAGRARIYGIELSLKSRPTQWLDLWAGWGAMKSRRLDVDSATDMMEYRPSQKATASATVIPTDWLAITLVQRYVGSQWFLNSDTLRWGSLGSYRMTDARVDLIPTPGLRVWVRATNLTDANAMGRYSHPQAGRQLFVGASFEWHKDQHSLGAM